MEDRKTQALTKFDSRLLLFQALEFGCENNQLEGSFLKEIEKEVAGIAFALTQKYYEILSEDDLTRAVKSVIGIMNLAVEANSEHSIDKASVFLKQYSLKQVFKIGWKLVLEYSVFVSRKKDAELFGVFKVDNLAEERGAINAFYADPEQDWNGWTDWQERKEKYRVKTLESDFELWIENNLRVSKTILDKKKTLIFSLLISSEPFTPLSLEQFVQVLQKVEGSTKDQLEEILVRFKSIVPSKYHLLLEPTDSWCRKSFDEIQNDGGIAFFEKELVDSEDKEKGHAQYSTEIEVSVTHQDAVNLAIYFDRSKIKSYADLYQFLEDIDKGSLAQALLYEINNLQPNAFDVKVNKIVELIEGYKSEEWQGQIPWEELGNKTIFGVVKHFDQGDFEQEKHDLAVSLAGERTLRDLESWLSSLPVHVVSYIADYAPEVVHVNVQLLGWELYLKYMKKHEGWNNSIFMLDPAASYSLWADQTTMSKDVKYLEFLFESGLTSLKMPEEQVLEHLAFEVHTIIGSVLQQDSKFSRNKPPFYGIGIGKELKEFLSVKQYQLVRRKVMRLQEDQALSDES